MSLAETIAIDRARASAYEVSVSPSWEPVLDEWTRMAEAGGALAFQSRAWLEPWRSTFGRRRDLECLAVTIRSAAGPVVALPLVRERRRLWRIGFADGGVADYNAPILGRAVPQDAAGAKLMWRALLRALPAADVVRFERMPRRIGGRVNPFALLPGARPSAAGGLVLAMRAGYAAWRAALPRRYRMELGRCGRLFDSLERASFARIETGGAAVFEALERLQRGRIAALGRPYALDDPEAKAFYRRLAADGGPGILTALRAEGEVVAALFGLRQGATFTMLRIGAAPEFSRMSPARDLIVRTMDLLSGEGVTTFDFGLGDYAYKRKLGGEPHDLVDLVGARTLAGTAEVGDFRLRAYVRAVPRLEAAARRAKAILRRAQAPDEE